MSTSLPASWRIFCAVEISEEARRGAVEHARRVGESAPRARIGWERPEKMHLTLKFFGDVDTTRLSDIEDALTRSAAGVGPFALKLQGAGTFPLGGPAAPRVLWLGVEDVSGGLAELRQRFERECEAAGFAREARPFRPHLTLGRVRVPDAEARRAADAHRVLGLTPVAFVVTEVCLVRSELGPGGSRYSVCARQVLAEESGESDHPRVTSDRRRE